MVTRQSRPARPSIQLTGAGCGETVSVTGPAISIMPLKTELMVDELAEE